MCLSVPALVMSVDGENAEVSVGGTVVRANLSLVEGIEPGDYILLHTGFALQKINADEAAETLNTFKEFDDLNKEMDLEEKLSGERIV
jgi:hydrogenase expression/formation protein HypC